MDDNKEKVSFVDRLGICCQCMEYIFKMIIMAAVLVIVPWLVYERTKNSDKHVTEVIFETAGEVADVFFEEEPEVPDIQEQEPVPYVEEDEE